ncbi:MAG: N-acetyl-gamma-glutamyl-phosphate reductase [Chloroflexi bacterium]|nr:MAG: N-acetyl-gamma-glutamyl-phosphate reductase [Chloroflexota bacterium]
MIRAGVFGATGYTGYELIRILGRHPAIRLVFATSQSYAGKTLNQVFPQAPALPLVRAEEAALPDVDVVFLCLPHGAAAETAVSALEAGCHVIDLSADFRLHHADTYTHWYNIPHPAPHWLAQAVYGLTEINRPHLSDTRLVANPGCYPTSILLALYPLLKNKVPLAGPIIADSKSGVSGAGRVPKQHTHFVEVADNFSPYNIGRSHRHLPEIEQFIQAYSPQQTIIFSPHLLPVPRGILSTIYVPLANPHTLSTWQELYATCYQHEPFVQVLPAGELATLAHVTHTNQCVISLTLAQNVLILTSAIDNLIKGAAGQAVQNMNVVFGLDETSGLCHGGGV